MSENVLQLASNSLLAPAGLEDAELDKVLDNLLGPSVDNADLYFQHSSHESWVLEDGIVRDGSYGIEQGVGARAISGEKTGFAYSDELRLESLLEAAGAARAIARNGTNGKLAVRRRVQVPVLYSNANPAGSLKETEKIDLLRRLDAHARAQDSRVKEVIVNLVGARDTVVVVASDGTMAGDVRPLVRCNVQVVTEQNGRREIGSGGGGGRYGYEVFLTDDAALRYAEEAVRQALLNLEAIDAPAGTMPVVLGPGWPGVMLHEAVGHGLEGDFNRKGTSAFAGRLGQRVASPLCTVVDDGTLENRRGSLTIDDEGVPSQNTVLIEKGILKGYMQDKMNARLMGVSSTGNGRRESFSHLPMPRMTNTYMLPGDHEPDEIIRSVKKGLYAVNFGGGQVDITSGKFVFSTSEAYLIEDGRVTAPVKGATLIGSGPEALTTVSMVGNNLELDSGVGVCGKEGQSVPVGVGQPTLKLDELTVGGTQS